MFWDRPRSPAEAFTHKLESLGSEISRLAQASRGKDARALAHRSAERLLHHAQPAGSRALLAIEDGLSVAGKGGKILGRELDLVLDRSRETAARHPAATAAVVLGVGLTLAFVLSLTVRKSRRRKFASPRGYVRRPPAKASR